MPPQLLATHQLLQLSTSGTVYTARGWRLGLLFICMFLLASNDSYAQWPQLLGPNRDGSLAPSIRLEKLPKEMKPLWRIEAGDGFSGPAIVDGTVYLLERMKDQEVLRAVSLKSGAEKWQAEWPARYVGGLDTGPRAVPLVSDGKAYCYGAAGDLACIDIQNGTLLWRRELRKEYDAPDGYFGAGSSPVMTTNALVVCVGGKQAGIVALDPDDGSTIWTAATDEASYASPIVIQDGGRELVLAVMRYFTLLIDASSGQLVGDVRFGSRGPTVNAATPIAISPNTFFLTASYGIGSLIVEADAQGLREVERSRLAFSQYNTPTKLGDLLLSIDGREDVGVASLTCIDIGSRKKLWKKEGYGVAHFLKLNPSQVLVLKLDGTLEIISINQGELVTESSTQLPPGNYRALPAIVDGKLLVREVRSDPNLTCYQLPVSE